jgi:hypothetical protein
MSSQLSQSTSAAHRNYPRQCGGGLLCLSGLLAICVTVGRLPLRCIRTSEAPAWQPPGCSCLLPLNQPLQPFLPWQ